MLMQIKWILSVPPIFSDFIDTITDEHIAVYQENVKSAQYVQQCRVK